MERDRPRTALYLRVSTPDQKPDLQYDGLRAYAVRAGLEVVQDYCDVGVSRVTGRSVQNRTLGWKANQIRWFVRSVSPSKISIKGNRAFGRPGVARMLPLTVRF